MTDEIKRKISNSLKGHPCYKNKERNRRISEANKGKKMSEETKKKLSQALKKENPTYNHKEYMKKYMLTSRGRFIKYMCNIKRRARKKRIIEDFSNREWLNKLNKTNGFCPKCKKDVGILKLAIDHIFPLSKAEIGRSYTIDDIQPLCKSCNSKKSNKIIIGIIGIKN